MLRILTKFQQGSDRKANLLALSSFLLFAIAICALAFSRSFMILGTETDYLGGFVPDAERFLRGEPLQLPYHPPLYPLVIAPIWLVVRNWFTTGLVVSVVSSIGLLGVSYLLCKKVWSTAAGLGAIFGLVASPVFLTYSALATSDVFFTFLYWSAFLLATIAVEQNKWRYWLATGVVAGVVLLTRTNGLPVLLLLAAPLVAVSGPVTQRAKSAGMMGAGVMIVVAAWVLFAVATDSRFAPEYTHGSLAQNYFAPEGGRYTGPERRVLEQQFGNVLEVIAHDPVHVAKTYVRDLAILVRRIFYHGQLLAFPASHLALPGLLVLLLGTTSRMGILIVVVSILHVLLLNFAVFADRFFLFLTPLLGAGAGVLLERMLELTKARGARIRLAAIGVTGLLVVAGVSEALRETVPALHADDSLFAAVAKAQPLVASNATVVGFRPQIAYYLDADFVLFPPRIETPAELRQFLLSAKKEGPVFMSFGRYERRRLHIAGVSDWQGAQGAPEWLVPIAQAPAPDDWTLYEFQSTGEVAPQVK